MAVRNMSREAWQTMVFAHGWRDSHGNETWLCRERCPNHQHNGKPVTVVVSVVDSRGKVREERDTLKHMRDTLGNKPMTYLGSQWRPAHSVDNLR